MTQKPNRPKPIRLKTNDTIPRSMLVVMHSGKLVSLCIAGRDDLDPASMKAGSVVYAHPETKARLDAAMKPTEH